MADMPMPVGDEPVVVVELEFARSAMIEHEWTGTKSSRVNVSFCFTYSTVAEHAELAAETMSGNWEAACESARSICEDASLFDDKGRIQFEEMLCERMTEMLFSNGEDATLGTVERIIWKRLTWG